MIILVQMDTHQEERKITWSAQGKNYRTNRRAQEKEILTNRRAQGKK